MLTPTDIKMMAVEELTEKLTENNHYASKNKIGIIKTLAEISVLVVKQMIMKKNKKIN